MKIRAVMRSCNPEMEECFHRFREEDGSITELRITSSECDYDSGRWVRKSTDNGRTWSEWKTLYSDEGGRHGKLPNSPEGDELLRWSDDISVHDPVSGCAVGAGSDFYYLKGHDPGYFDMWEKGEDNFRTHAYFYFRRPDGTAVRRMLEFEEGGEDFDPEEPRKSAYIDKNRCMASGLRILPDGDLGFFVYPTMTLACALAGVDVNTFFPSCPNLQVGLIYARAHWDAEKNDYDLSYSAPIMLSDLQSSRGIMEPCLLPLENGRIMIVFRGSNMTSEVWHTRIDPRAPGYKWYVISDDGGRTFSVPMPWHFDTREAVYSPASISHFFVSSKTGKAYWVGNIVEPSLIDGNDPRYPLQICEVDRTYGYLLKDTLTEIEGLRDGQTYVELSNFNLFENPETLDLEVRVTKINFNGQTEEEGYWYTEAWEYTVELE